MTLSGEQGGHQPFGRVGRTGRPQRPEGVRGAAADGGVGGVLEDGVVGFDGEQPAVDAEQQ